MKRFFCWFPATSTRDEAVSYTADAPDKAAEAHSRTLEGVDVRPVDVCVAEPDSGSSEHYTFTVMVYPKP